MSSSTFHWLKKNRASLAAALLGGAGLAGCAEPTASAATEVRPVFGPDSAWVRVAAGPHYARRGWWWQRLWGPHYRPLWATPITAPVLRLGAAELLPLQAGGSFQTNTLRLRTADGRIFVLRSVDKDLSRKVSAGWLDRIAAQPGCGCDASNMSRKKSHQRRASPVRPALHA